MKLPRPAPRKLAIGVAIAIAVLVVLYGVGANVLLSTGGLARIVSRHPERLRLQYTHATTVWPGRVHVAGLDLRGRNAHVEWELHVDACDVDVSLFSLLRRRLHVNKLIGDGAVVRLRLRREASEITPDLLASLPPIDGFPAAPRIDDPVLEKKEPWAIALEGADGTHVREIWIDTLRLAGDTHLTGGFELVQKHLTIARAAFTVHEGTLTTAGDLMASELDGGGDIVIDPVDLNEVKGAAVLRAISSHSAVRGKVGGIAFLRHFVDDPELTFAGGAGVFGGEMIAERGVIKKGSRARLELEPLRVGVSGRTFASRLRADLTTGEDDAGGWAKVDVALGSFAYFERGAKAAALTSEAIAASARVPETDMVKPPRDVAYSWDAPRIDAPDLHVIDDYLSEKEPFHVDGGKAALSLRGNGTRSELTCEAGLDGSLAWQLLGSRMASPIASKVHARADFAARRIDLSGSTLDLASPSIGGGAPHAGWWGKIKMDTALVHASPPLVKTTVSTACRDGAPLLAFYAGMRGTPATVHTALAILPDALIASMTGDLRGSAHLSGTKGLFEARGIDVRGSSSRLRGDVRRRGESKEGALLIEAGPASAGVGFDGQKSEVVVVDATKWFEARPPLPPAR